VDERLRLFFSPKSVAVIGASNNPSKLGYTLFRNLKNYRGKVYPVHVREKEIQGVKVLGKSVLELPEPIDLAVIVTPAKTVPEILNECGQKGIEAVIVITAGFSEIGNVELEKRIVEIANDYNMRLLGPNCVGIMDTKTGLNATFVTPAKPGRTAFVSQSGALGAAVIYKCVKENIGFSKFISLGNMADVNFADILEYLAWDENTNAIALYMEGVKKGQEFMKKAKEAVKQKPVIVLKAGKSTAGARAVASHTGSLAGAYTIYKAAFKQSGVITANGIEDMLSMARSFDQPPAKGNRVAILTNAGGPGVLTTDAVQDYGLTMADLNEKTVKRLKEILPPIASLHNPIDILASGDGEKYEEVSRILLEDENVDILIVICVVPTFAEMTRTEHAEGVIRALKSQGNKKPVLALFMAGEVSLKAKELLEKNGIPTYENPANVAAAAYALYAYGKNVRKWIV